MSLTYTIGTLSGLTGLSHHTIRAWERRYNALTPGRSDTNRRIYNQSDLERLALLKRVVELGHSIGQVANLSTDQLRALDPTFGQGGFEGSNPQVANDLLTYLTSCISATSRMDPVSLEESLVKATAARGILGMLEGVAIPFVREIEAGWMDGTLHIYHEHMASAVLRTYLDHIRTSLPVPLSAPRLIVTTPQNQFHEIGALLVAIVATTQSWSVTYLGPNLPAEEIAKAAIECNARAIALSIVFPLNDSAIPFELRKLRKLIGNDCKILAGGRATCGYMDALNEIEAKVANDLWDLGDLLNH